MVYFLSPICTICIIGTIELPILKSNPGKKEYSNDRCLVFLEGRDRRGEKCKGKYRQVRDIFSPKYWFPSLGF
jgi:hypothetical protein